MKTKAKRSLSLLLMLAMVLSLFSGLTFQASAAEPSSAAEVSYRKSGSYVYNWGKRDTTATFLTTYAQEYYTGSYSYDTLSAKSGSTSTSASDIYSSALGSAIHSMLAAKQTRTTSYNGTKELYRYTDCEENQDKISSYYSAVAIGPGWGEGGSWNREHTWPNSKGLNGADENDIMMLRPTATSENSSRGNTAYGESYYDPNGNGQSLHGDVARLMLQHLMRWGNTDSFYGASGVMESRDVLLKWLAEDPVDTWEMGRNDAVQSITGVRNVFVDYPELAFKLLGADVPANYPTPSGGSTASYTITATSNNTSYGTVSVSGSTITAAPKTGYAATGYTVVSGTATVTQNGNVFTVTASSDCTVRIIFTKIATYTVSFSVPSGVTAPTSVTATSGTVLTLSAPTGTPSDSSKTYTFLGWAAAVTDNVTTKPAYYTGSYTVTGSATLYALYKYSVGGDGSSDTYTMFTGSSVENGSYVIVSASTGLAMKNTVSNNWITEGSTYSGDSIVSPSDADVWTITDGVIAAANGKGALYSSGAKKVELSTTSNTVWSFSLSDGKWTISNSSVGTLSYNTSGGWRPYSGSGYGTDKTFYLYKAGDGGTLYYTTVIGEACTHSNTVSVAQVDATCTKTGTTAGVKCADCGLILSGCTEIPAAGHSWNDGVVTTAATCTATGVKTYTCTVCSETKTETIDKIAHTPAASYKSDASGHWHICAVCGQSCNDKAGHTFDDGVITTPATETTDGVKTYTCTACSYKKTESIPSTGSAFTVSFSVPDGVDAVDSIVGNSKTGITLPSAGTPSSEYTFVGWTTAAMEEDSATAPTYYEAESTYNDGTATLIALYSYRQVGTGGGDYVKLTSTPDDLAGEYLIVYEKSSVIFDSSLETLDAAKNTQSVTISDNTISAAQGDAYSFTIGTDGSILAKNGKYIGRTTNSNGLNTSDTALTHTITISSGTATIKSSGGATLKFNNTTDQNRFRYYKSGQQAIQLYRKSGSSGTTYYTTLNGSSVCVHSWNDGVVTTAATCTQSGEKTFTCTKCGETKVETIAALGHSYKDTVVAATCTEDGSKTSVCTVCGDTRTETIAALGHDYDSGVVTTEPTATEPGVKTYTCSRCGSAYTESIPALGEKVRYARATEITSGADYIMAFCYNGTYYAIGSGLTPTEVAVENDVISLNSGEAYLWNIAATDSGYTVAHDGSYIVGSSSSTTLSVKSTAYEWLTKGGQADGTFWFYNGTRGIGMYNASSIKNYALSNATNSGTSYTFDIYLFTNACDHANAVSEVTAEATCTAAGTTVWTCPTCGESWTTSEPAALGHDFVLNAEKSTPATCETDGSSYYVCSRCETGKTEKIAALGHDYQVTEDVKATCTEDGHTTYVCSRDASHTYTVESKATGHSWTTAETTDAYEKLVCENCKEEKYVYIRTISFVVPEGIDAIADMTAKDGESITLPTPNGTLTATAQNYVFVGWTVGTVKDTTDAVTAYEAGAAYEVSENVTFNALYSYVGDNSFGGENTYRLVTDLSILSDGYEVVIANDGKWQSKTMAMAQFTDNGLKLRGADVTVSNDQITLSDASSVQVFTLQKLEDGTFRFLSNLTDAENNDYYLASCTNTASSNDIALTTVADDAARWTLSFYEGTANLVKMTACGTYTANTVLFNSGNYSGFFSCYGETYYGSETMPSNIYAIRLFASNPIYHFTTEPQKTCEHTDLTYTDNGDGTHTVRCANESCDYSTVSAHVNGDPTVETAASCTEEGTQKLVCTLCGAETIETIEALGHDYVSEVTKEATCSAAGEMTYTCSRCADSYTEEIPATEHSFENGVCTVCGASLYVLVKEAPENWEGEYLIVYQAADGAYVFDGKNDASGNYLVGTYYSDDMSTICVADPDSCAVNLVPSSNGYNIMNAAADWFSFKDARNGFATGSTAADYTVTLNSDASAVIANVGNYRLKFNTQSKQFRFYGTSIYTKVFLYEKFGTCHHDWGTGTVKTAATCTTDGLLQYTCSLCAETKNETIKALGHDYAYNTVEATCTAEGYTEITCSRCDYSEMSNITPAKGHDFSVEPSHDDADHYLAPTVDSEGLMYYKCSRCDEWGNATVLPRLTAPVVKSYTQLTASDFESYDTALANVGQFIIVAEADGKYYALGTDAAGSYLSGVEISVSSTTASVSSELAVAKMVPDYEASNYTATATGLGFRNGEGNYLHLNSASLNFAATGNNGLFTLAKAYTNSDFTIFVEQSEKYLSYNASAQRFELADSKSNSTKLYIFTADVVEITENDEVIHSLGLKAGAETTLGYRFDFGGTVASVEWKSGDENIVLVDENGDVLAGAEGTTTISVTLHTYAADSYSNYRTYTAVLPVTVSADGHVHSAVLSVDAKAPTCTEEGNVAYWKCSCGKYFSDAACTTEIAESQITLEALGHSDYQYTDNGDGTHKVTCGVCSEVITASEAHVYVEGTCPCGATETPVVPKDENLKFLNVSLSLQECIQFTYMAKYTGVLNNYDSYYVAFSRNDFKDGLVENQDSGYKYSTRYHCFSYSVWSMQMNDEITATLYGVKDGVIYEGETVVKSVRDYVEEKFSAVNEATKLVYANMLQYGAMAQVNFAYDTENLVTTGLRDEITAYITTEAPATVNQTAATNNGLTAVKLAQNALGTQDAVKLQYVLNIGTSDVNSLYAVATWVNEKGETVEKRYEGNQFTKQGKYYIVLVDGLNAVNGKVPVSLTVYDASTNAAVSETFTCSIQSQVYARQTATNNTTAKVNALNLMNALMNYYNACEALFG